MENIWFYEILIWHKLGLEEVLLKIDLNKCPEIDFDFWGEFEFDILKLLGLEYEDQRIISCRQRYFNLIEV